MTAGTGEFGGISLSLDRDVGGAEYLLSLRGEVVARCVPLGGDGEIRSAGALASP